MMSSPKELNTKPEFVTVRRAAEMLEVSERTVRRTIAAGELDAVLVRSCVRIPVSALKKFVQDRRYLDVKNRQRSARTPRRRFFRRA